VTAVVAPDLDIWLPEPALRVAHRGVSSAPAERLWEAARTVRLGDTALLGRLVRWRIPGTTADLRFDDLFRRPPFAVLHDGEAVLVSGIVGPIWTLRRDYVELAEPREEFRHLRRRGTARVLFASWVEASPEGGSALYSEARVDPVGKQGRLGVAAVRPLVAAFHHLIGSEGIAAAVRLAESPAPHPDPAPHAG
jgi:hypothetical protein